MKRVSAAVMSVVFLLCASFMLPESTAAQSGAAQTVPALPEPAAANPIVPPLVNFSGVLTDLDGKPMTGVAGVTFLLYKDSQGGAPLWLETQNVRPDKTGRYTAMLGSASSQGLPAGIFAAGQAHWLGVQVSGQAEQPRVLLVSAPYALKAGDAETVGGLPASAFMLATPSSNAGATGNIATALTSGSAAPRAPLDVTTSGGTVNYIPLWDSTSDILNSAIFQVGSGTTAKIGINTATPVSALDIKGSSTVRGTLSLPVTGNATATAGKNSQPLSLAASAFNSSSSAPVSQTFEWLAEPAGNDTATPSATLNLLFGTGATKPTETGLSIASNGQIIFVAGQTFPGGGGTITGVTAGTGLTGGGSSGSVTLNVDATKIPQLSAANTFAGNQTVTGNVTASGEVQGAVVNATTSFDLGGASFASGSAVKLDAFLGFAGNAAITGGSNTAVGYHALLSDTTGGVNVAIGTSALTANTTGEYNVAAGANALGSSTSGFANTGIGNAAGKTADASKLTGKNNTALGTGASFSTGTLTNASAIGANAEVGESNALVLGGIAGVNGQTVSVNVGIGTTIPGATLDVYAGPQAISAGSFDGFSAALGSGNNGSDGMASLGGDGDTNGSQVYGGNGVVGQGGSGVSKSGYGYDGVGGIFSGGGNSVLGDGVDGYAGSGYAGNFTGDVLVSGTLSATIKHFKIDHPLDPANKYLVHASVESSEMKNIYDGNVTTDGDGHATVQLPEWFQALNTEFRYQLTVIGQFAQAIVAHKIENNRFEIRTSLPNVEVSWQVTGVRQDAYAQANPLVVEQEKDERTRGYYIRPELFGAPPEKQIEFARHPQTMKRLQEMQARKHPAGSAVRPVAPQNAANRLKPAQTN